MVPARFGKGLLAQPSLGPDGAERRTEKGFWGSLSSLAATRLHPQVQADTILTTVLQTIVSTLRQLAMCSRFGPLMPVTRVLSIGGLRVWGAAVLLSLQLASSAFAQTADDAERLAAVATPLLAAARQPDVAQTVGSLGVVSAATFEGDGISPGQLVTIFGSGIGPQTPAGPSLDATGRVADEAGGVQVLFGGETAPILYASDGQLNVQVPYSVEGSSSVSISTYLGGRLTGETTAPVAPTELGVFLLDPSSRLAATFNLDGTLNTPFNPAAPSEIITLFGTGYGQTTPPTDTGVLATTPLPRPIVPISAGYWSGANSGALEVLYAGPAPGFVGLFQLNVRLPANLGDAHGAFHVLLQASGTEDRAAGVVAVSREGRMSFPDFYIASATEPSEGPAAPGGTIPLDVRVANLGAGTNRPFVMWIDFTQGARVVRGPVCEFESGLASGATAACRGTVQVPEDLSGAFNMRFWVNPFTSFNSGWVAELNADNNRAFTSLSGSARPGPLWSGVLQFEGQMTLNGRTAPATIDIFDGVLAGQVLGLDPSNLFSMVFTNDSGPTISGNTISYQVRSDSLLFGSSVQGFGRGTFTLTMASRTVGQSASGTMDITYAGGTRYTGRFVGTLIDARE